MASNNHGLGKILQLREFKWVLRSSIWIVFDYFLLINPSDRSKISSDQYRIQFEISQTHLSFLANIPFKHHRRDDVFGVKSRFSVSSLKVCHNARQLFNGWNLRIQLFNSWNLRIQLFNGWNLRIQLFNGWNLRIQLFNSWNLRIQSFNGWNLRIQSFNSWNLRIQSSNGWNLRIPILYLI